MKECRRCNLNFNDNSSFCGRCGGKLRHKPNIPKLPRNNIIIFIITGLVIAAIGIGFVIHEINDINSAKHEIENYRTLKQLSEPDTYDLKINRGWTVTQKRNYVYINGSVTNCSYDKTIDYFEILAKFCNSNGEVIDSDWTNGSGPIEPGETREFQIMHKTNADYQNVRLSVKEVS